MERERPVRVTWVAGSLIVAIAILIALFLARLIMSGGGGGIGSMTATTAETGHKVMPMGDGMIYYDGGTLHALDEKGRQIWSYPAGSLASFSVGEGGVATWRGSMLSLLSIQTGELLSSTNADSPIIEAKLGRAYAAVQVESGKNEGRALSPAQREHNTDVLLLDPGGRQVERLEMQSRTILDFGFFRADQLFWTMALSTQGTEPICLISSYRPGRMMNGFFHDAEQVTYKALFQSSKIRTVGLTYIKDFDYRGKEYQNNRMLVYGWRMVDVDTEEDEPTMAFAPVGQADGTAGITDVRLIRGQEDRRIRLPQAAKSVHVKQGTLYAFSTDRVTLFRPGEAEPVAYALPMQIDSVIGLTGGNAAIVTRGNVVFLMQLTA